MLVHTSYLPPTPVQYKLLGMKMRKRKKRLQFVTVKSNNNKEHSNGKIVQIKIIDLWIIYDEDEEKKWTITYASLFIDLLIKGCRRKDKTWRVFDDSVLEAKDL